MSEIKVDTLTGKTTAGDITVTSEGGAATMQLQQGLAKAWVNVDGNSTAHINDSFNAASLNDLGTGRYQVTYTNAMNISEYFAFDSNNSNISGTYSLATTSVNIFANTDAGIAQDVSYIGCSALGDLA